MHADGEHYSDSKEVCILKEDETSILLPKGAARLINTELP